MTSTGIQVGLPENTPRKAASNQGRTHSDIFGITEQTKTEEKVVQDVSDSKEKKDEENTEKTENKATKSSTRVRCPPGGFSSGLW